MYFKRPVVMLLVAFAILQSGIGRAAAEDLPFADKRHVGYFDKDYGRCVPYFATITPDRRAELEGYLVRLENWLKPISPGNRQHPDVVACYDKIAALRAKLDAAISAAASAPAPAPAAQAPAPKAAATAGAAQPLSAEDKKRIAEFRMEFNRLSYAVEQDLDPLSLQDPAVRARATGNLAKLGAPLDAVVGRQDPSFLSEKSRLDAVRARFEAAVAESQAREREAGDIDKELDLIQKHFPMASFDPQLPAGATPEAVEDWARRLKGWLTAVDQAGKFFRRAEGLSLKARSPEFRTYSYWFEQNVKYKITSALEWARRDFEAPIEPGLNPPTGGYYSTDPAYVAESVKLVEAGMTGARNLLAWQRGYLGAEDPATRASLEGLQRAMAKVAGGADAAIKNNRLPAPASADPKLMAIAEKTLAAEKGEWGILNWQRIVINYDKHTQEDVLERGEWLYYYKWEEFQVTFVEKVGSEYWIRTALLKNYLLGADIEPGKWSIASSQRWNRILPENIGK